MAKCIKCDEYTKYNGGRCIKCFNSNKSIQVETSEMDIDEDQINERYKNIGENWGNVGEKGLTEKEKNFNYNFIKGKLAETIVEQLFQACGYKVIRYGMENTIPEIIN